MKILKLKNVIIEIQNSTEQWNHRLNIAEENINELENELVDKYQKEGWEIGFHKSIKKHGTWRKGLTYM